MSFTKSTYGSVIASFIAGGIALYYASRPSIRAVDTLELVEGVLERSAAVAEWPITGTVNDEIGWGSYILTNMIATASNPVTMWSFNPYPNNPVISSAPSHDLLVQTLQQIERLVPYYVRSYTSTSIVMWDTTSIWTHCSIGDGTSLNWTIAVSNDTPYYGPATNLSYGVQSNVLFEAYRLLSVMSNTTRVAQFYTFTNGLEYYISSNTIVSNVDAEAQGSQGILPPSLSWVLGLDNTNQSIVDPIVFRPEDSADSMTQCVANYSIDYEYASFMGVSLDRLRTTASWANSPSSGWWTATLRQLGGGASHSYGQYGSHGYGYVPIADLGSGVVASIDLSIGVTGLIEYCTGEVSTNSTYQHATNHFGPSFLSSKWTQACMGSMTGLLSNPNTNLSLPDIWSNSFPDSVSGPYIRSSFTSNITYITAEYISFPVFGGYAKCFYPRQGVISWKFLYCR